MTGIIPAPFGALLHSLSVIYFGNVTFIILIVRALEIVYYVLILALCLFLCTGLNDEQFKF